MKKLTKTRFAPTPSGYLHIGNICNLLLIYCYSKLEDVNLHLRIDDIDRSRFRVKYLEDIFRIIDFLDIRFNSGPIGINDFEQNYSQHKKIEKYRDVLNQISGQTFLCECTRTTLKGHGEIYPGFCYGKKLINRGDLKIRLNCPNQDFIFLKNGVQKIFSAKKIIGDFILWNYVEERPSYQLVSMVEDLEDGVNLIIRGEDLFNSTLSQELLKNLLLSKNSQENFSYIHHGLLKIDGEKISKSVQKNSARSISDLFSKKEIYSQFWYWWSGERAVIKEIKELEQLFLKNYKTPSYESVLLEKN